MIRRSGRRHLGDLAAALVDGELDPEARDRALVHIARCTDCRAEVAEQRRLKAMLRGLAAPQPDDATLGALADLARTARAPRRRLSVPPPATHHAAHLPARFPARLALAGGGALAVTFGVALAVGGQPDSARPVTPPVNLYVVEHLATTGQLPLTSTDVGAAAVTAADPVPSP